MNAKDSEYWDGVAQSWSGRQRQALWRRFCDRINGRMIRQAVADCSGGRALKTDLFDETTGSSELISELARGERQVFGIDLSPVSARIARRSTPTLSACASDVRRLPFADRVFDIVLSNSTLDHMDSLQDVAGALGEIHRVLRPGGRLLMTLDNLSNPVVALRAVLPQRWLHALGLVPYYVGATCGPRRLRRLVEEAGLHVEEIGAMMHCPRLPAVATANLLGRIGSERLENLFCDILLRCEGLERLSTRYLSGYFVRLIAVRR